MNNLLQELYANTGFTHLDWRMCVMWAVVAVLLYLAVFRKFEPLLLVPIAFGALLANLPTQGIVNQPAGIIRSEVDGQLVHSLVSVGDRVKLSAVEKRRPTTVGELGQMDLRQLLSGTAHPEYGQNSLLQILRPNSSEGGATAVVQVGALSFRADDVLVWANASGRVVELPLAAGEVCVAGEAVAELHSVHTGGLFHYIQLGILLELFPPLIFLGVGALTDFGPLIANPRTLLLGGAAQFGVFVTYIGAQWIGFTGKESGAIAIIGGADGPTSIFLANARITGG